MSETPNMPIPEQRPPYTPGTPENPSVHNPYDLPAMLARAQKIARGLLPCVSDADEAAQNSVVNYWLRCEAKGEPSSPAAYLGTVVRNQVTTHWRREQSRAANEVPLDASSNDEFEDTFMGMLASRGPGVQQQLCDDETMAELGINWQLLSTQQQQYLARWLDGKESSEIGKEFGTSANQVSACISRARTKLKRLFELSLLPTEELDIVLEADKATARLYRKKQALQTFTTED